VTSSDKKKETVIEVGDELLVALGAVAGAARRALSDGSSGISTSALINPSNMMVGVGAPERHAHALNSAQRDALRRLLIEPFIGRIEVEWKNENRPPQTFYLARLSAAGLNDVVRGAHFVTSMDDLGHLAEYEAGETATIEVRGRERTARILKRVVLGPRERSSDWDALVHDFEAAPWGTLLALLAHESLRQALGLLRQEDAAAEDVIGRLLQGAADTQLERQKGRRRAIDRIALRDRPILNKFQGAIFRLPLNRQVMLFGPPGSGKTTTLIRRLAQKRTAEALTDAERALIDRMAGANPASADSWAMFSPGELLKLYLGDAFNKQGVPDAGNVRTWEKERLDLGRNILSILRSPSSGRFQMEDGLELLADRSSPAISNLHDEFYAHVDTALLRRCEDALANLVNGTDERSRHLAGRIQTGLGRGKGFSIDDMLGLGGAAANVQQEVKRLGDQITDALKKINNLLVNRNKGLLNEIAAHPASRQQEQDDDEDDDDETSQVLARSSSSEARALSVLWNALRNWARAVAEGRRALGGQSGRVIELIGARLPPDADFSGIGENIKTRSSLRTLLQVPRSLVLGVPAAYGRFRRQMIREGRYFTSDQAIVDLVSRNMISPDEVDIVLLAMLRNARRVWRDGGGRRDPAVGYDWLQALRNRYLAQVFVDEATDLSAVQLACTIELSNPDLRSWFACGDLRQRVTASGIRSETEIDWLNGTTGVRIDIRKIDIGYRQSRKLRDFSDALGALLDRESVKTKPPSETEEADAGPLLAEQLSGAHVGKWLAARIEEVEDAIGWLPSIAVFVDGDNLVDPLVEVTKAALAQHSTRIVGCKEGRVVGDASEVRVFDIQHIKGLEFEAVFFIGIDKLAERLPDLFQRFLYVGVTRAATYLGITCEGGLPKLIEPLRSHFDKRADWAQPW
jgi:hypothetical protein